MGKAAEKPVAPGIDIDAYRKRIAAAVELEVSELTASRRDDSNPGANPNAAMLRMVAAYCLTSRDQLSIADIARILDKSKSWVRASAVDVIFRTTTRSGSTSTARLRSRTSAAYGSSNERDIYDSKNH